MFNFGSLSNLLWLVGPKGVVTSSALDDKSAIYYISCFCKNSESKFKKIMIPAVRERPRESPENTEKEMFFLSTELIKAIRGTPFRVILLANTESEFQKEIAQFIGAKAREATRKIEETCTAFNAGYYDSFLSTKCPETQALQELAMVIEEFPDRFVYKLFSLCKSSEVFSFWVQNGVDLPVNSPFIAASLGNNLVVLQALKERGFFEKLDNDDRELLLQRAKRFKNEGWEFIQQNAMYDPTKRWILK